MVTGKPVDPWEGEKMSDRSRDSRRDIRAGMSATPTGASPSQPSSSDSSGLTQDDPNHVALQLTPSQGNDPNSDLLQLTPSPTGQMQTPELMPPPQSPAMLGVSQTNALNAPQQCNTVEATFNDGRTYQQNVLNQTAVLTYDPDQIEALVNARVEAALTAQRESLRQEAFSVIHSAQQDRDASIHQAQNHAAHEIGVRDQMLNSADHALRDREQSLNVARQEIEQRDHAIRELSEKLAQAEVLIQSLNESVQRSRVPEQGSRGTPAVSPKYDLLAGSHNDADSSAHAGQSSTSTWCSRCRKARRSRKARPRCRTARGGHGRGFGKGHKIFGRGPG